MWLADNIIDRVDTQSVLLYDNKTWSLKTNMKWEPEIQVEQYKERIFF